MKRRSIVRELEARISGENRGFKSGVEAAAGVIEMFNSTTTHPFRLDDVVRCKLNVTRRVKPRRNKKAAHLPHHAWLHGFVDAIVELCRNHHQYRVALALAHRHGITIERCKNAEVSAYNLREMKRLGVPDR